MNITRESVVQCYLMACTSETMEVFEEVFPIDYSSLLDYGNWPAFKISL